MKPLRLRYRLRRLLTRTAAAGVGALWGGFIGARLDREISDLDDEELAKLAERYLPLLMSFSDRTVPPKNFVSYVCDDCKRAFMPVFMLRDELWWNALSDAERCKQFDMQSRKPLCAEHSGKRGRVALCLRCCSKRLGRPLHAKDFDEEYWTSAMLKDAAEVVMRTPSEQIDQKA